MIHQIPTITGQVRYILTCNCRSILMYPDTCNSTWCPRDPTLRSNGCSTLSDLRVAWFIWFGRALCSCLSLRLSFRSHHSAIGTPFNQLVKINCISIFLFRFVFRFVFRNKWFVYFIIINYFLPARNSVCYTDILLCIIRIIIPFWNCFISKKNSFTNCFLFIFVMKHCLLSRNKHRQQNKEENERNKCYLFLSELLSFLTYLCQSWWRSRQISGQFMIPVMWLRTKRSREGKYQCLAYYVAVSWTCPIQIFHDWLDVDSHGSTWRSQHKYH